MTKELEDLVAGLTLEQRRVLYRILRNDPYIWDDDNPRPVSVVREHTLRGDVAPIEPPGWTTTYGRPVSGPRSSGVQKTAEGNWQCWVWDEASGDQVLVETFRTKYLAQSLIDDLELAVERGASAEDLKALVANAPRTHKEYWAAVHVDPDDQPGAT